MSPGCRGPGPAVFWHDGWCNADSCRGVCVTDPCDGCTERGACEHHRLPCPFA